MTDTRRDKERTRDGDDAGDLVAAAVAAGRPAGVSTTPRHLTVDACGTPGQRHLWARHPGRPGQPLVVRLRTRPQSQFSCPETDTTSAAETCSRDSRLDVANDGQQRSQSSDAGLAQHRRRRLILKTINRSWPTSTSTSVTPAGAPRDPRSAQPLFIVCRYSQKVR